jgi:hypothetical protein
LRGIADFLHTTYSADVANAIRTMKAVVITISKPPTSSTDSARNDIPVSHIDEYIWKENYNEQLVKKLLYDSSMPKAYIHVSIISVRPTSRMILAHPVHTRLLTLQRILLPYSN